MLAFVPSYYVTGIVDTLDAKCKSFYPLSSLSGWRECVTPTFYMVRELQYDMVF
jgi:hypothetical protein